MEQFEQRVLVLTPFGSDNSVICRVLTDAEIVAQPCAQMVDLCREIERGAATVVLAEEVLSNESRNRLRTALNKQPDWSELPVLVLVSSQRRRDDALLEVQRIEGTTHVNLLDRPMRIPSFLTAVQTAMRARQNQYEIRDELAERIRIEAALRESAQRLQMAQRAGRVGVFDWDLHTRKMVWTSELEEILGITPGAFDGSYVSWAERVHPEDLKRIEALFDDWLRGDSADRSWDYRYRRPDGKERWISARAHLLRDDNVKPVRMIGTQMDFTERKRTEEALRALNATLEERVAERSAEAERRARDLRRLAIELSDAEGRERKRIAKMLHDDLQQTLVAVKLRVESLGRCDGPVKRKSVAQLNDLIVTCLKITQGLNTELSPPVLQYGSLAEVFRWLSKWSSENYEVHVEVDIDDDTPTVPEQLNGFLFQAVKELIFNAKKHADAHVVRIALRVENKYLLVQVDDDGQNFNHALTEKQMQQPRGLGLFSIRERLESLDGKLEISNAPGGGARFRLSLPFDGITSSVTEHDEPTTLPTGEGSGVADAAGPNETIRLLVVDDHQVVRQGLISLLNSQTDLRVIGEAADGREAVEHADILHPDVIIMDAEMPSMNGMEATREVKRKQPDVLVVGISAHDEKLIRDSMLAAGADAFVSKDSPAEDLTTAIRSAVSQRKATRWHP